MFKEVKEINEEKLIQLTKDLIRIPSFVKGIDYGCEKDIAEFLAKRLKEAGFKVFLQEVMKDRPNVIGVLQGKGNGYSLMLNGHLDTVEVNKMKVNPFSGEIKNRRIYGRGAADMKGALAAMIIASEAIKELNFELKGDLIISGCVDEEGRGIGGKYLAESSLKADMAIVGEPTGLKLGIAHKGLTFIDIIAKGKAVHGSCPKLGKNAILIMNKIINLLNSEYSAALNKKKHSILGSPTFNIGFIEGGYRANVVPDFCRISIDRRLIPGENYRSVVKEIKKIIKKSRVNNIEVKALNWIKCNPMEISANELIVKSVSKNLKAITNMKPKIAGIPYWCDASSFVNIMKTPTLIFGPGELEQAHSSSEFISIKKLKIFAKTIFLTILDICNKEKPQL